MAKILKKMPKSKADAMYPWAEWFDGQARELAHGKDFATSAVTFSSTARTAAKRFGKTVHIAIRGDLVYLQASDNGKKPGK